MTLFSLISAAYGSVSDMELLWTGLAAAGASFSAYNVRDSILDYKALGAMENGRRSLARAAIKTEASRFAIQLIFIMIGVSAMFIPEAPDVLDQPLNIAITSFLIRWGLMVSAGLLLWKSYIVFKLRKELLESEDYHLPGRSKGE